MMSTNNKDLVFVRASIQKLGDKFMNNSSIFFNESDLQTELFTYLLEMYCEEEEIKNIFVWGPGHTKSKKKAFTRRLHSELLMAGRRIDLAVLDIRNVKFAINSKGRFGYIQLRKGKHIFIEIKASRTNRSNISSKNAWFGSVSSDIEKLNYLTQNYAHYCFMLCFDFNNLLDDSSVSLLSEQVSKNVELHYFKNYRQLGFLVD